MAKRRGEPGRLKIKLAELIRAKGFPVTEYDFIEALGYYRSSPYADVQRWTAPSTFQDASINLGSWDTMTECVKRGIVIAREDTFHWGVHAIDD